MLVLSRKLGQKLLIDGGIAITVLEIQGNRIRIGVEAPGHVGVLREELVTRAEPAAREAAVAGQPPPQEGRR